jgi:hypothetical protein
MWTPPLRALALLGLRLVLGLLLEQHAAAGHGVGGRRLLGRVEDLADALPLAAAAPVDEVRCAEPGSHA